MSKPLIIAAGGLILNENKDLLMIYRREHWDLPKGKHEAGESIEACALREVKEETGIDAQIVDFIGTTTHEYFNTWTNEDVAKETHWYLMSASKNIPLIPQTEEDIVKIEWVKKSDIPDKLKNTYPNIIDIIKRSGVLA